MEIKDQEVEKSVNIKKRIIIGIIISISILLIIYLSTSLYFMKRFYFGTKINGVSVTGKTTEDIEADILAESEAYILKLKQRGNIEENINGSDIEYKYNLENKIGDLKDNQSAFGWIYGVFNTSDYKLEKKVSYNDELLKKKFRSLNCFKNDNVIKPESAKIEYENKEYVIKDEVQGNKVNKDILYKKVKEALNNKVDEINLEEIECYEKPKYTVASKEVVNAKNTLDKYIGSVITHKFGDNKEVLNGDSIHNWLDIDKNFKVSINEEKAREYVNSLSIKYDTYGATRNFKTSIGTTVNVSGGNYGWLINYSEETETLINAIKDGKKEERQPIYAQTAVAYGANDFGNTYVEINLTTQHIWFYNDGVLITEGPMVSGNADSKHATPPGIYSLTYKEKNATLRGENYAAPVSYWMPFNGDIGIHDATWRSKFGGQIYITDGSHGCINTPYDVASKIFEYITQGTPVICYF
ncbi:MULTISPECIES: L,D-transpeptidase family protein [unclassified Clostridium]|uniref:L,D-transpeptidase family protein n=1 Tax=unclassified Clostridium TaxID=2614128 RepID=UPI003217435A